MKRNQMLLTFRDKEQKEYAKLMCRRKNTTLESYIIDNLEWDDRPECMYDDPPSKTICYDCQWIENCPDKVTK